MLQPPSAPVISSSRTNFLDNHWMKAALTLAEEALVAGEVPVGCVIVGLSRCKGHNNEKEIIASGRNRVNETRNATRHAELVALDDALERQVIFTSTTVTNCMANMEVYVTVEPCVMCAAALRAFGATRVVYGAENERFGGCGSVLEISAGRNLSSAAGRTFTHVGGLMAAEAVALLKRFYLGENPCAPSPKCKESRGGQGVIKAANVETC